VWYGHLQVMEENAFQKVLNKINVQNTKVCNNHNQTNKHVTTQYSPQSNTIIGFP
jgi:hypothetical protein